MNQISVILWHYWARKGRGGEWKQIANDCLGMLVWVMVCICKREKERQGKSIWVNSCCQWFCVENVPGNDGVNVSKFR